MNIESERKIVDRAIALSQLNQKGRDHPMHTRTAELPLQAPPVFSSPLSMLRYIMINQHAQGSLQGRSSPKLLLA